MRKRIWALLLILSMVLTAIPVCHIEAGSSIKVKATWTTSNKKKGRGYYTLKGVNSKNKVVWKYKTSTNSMTELSHVTYKARGNFVYMIDNNCYVRLNRKTGKQLVRRKVVNTKYSDLWSAALGWDSKNNMYAIGYYGSALYKITPKGKVLWRHNFGQDYYWGYKIKLQGGRVYVLFSGERYEGWKSVDTQTGKEAYRYKTKLKAGTYKCQWNTWPEKNYGALTKTQLTLNNIKALKNGSIKYTGSYKLKIASGCKWYFFVDSKYKEIEEAELADFIEQMNTNAKTGYFELLDHFKINNSGEVSQIYFVP